MNLQPALLGGLFIGVLSALPIISIANFCCCLWVVTGGILTAYLDQQADRRPMTIGRGATAGLLAGVIGAVVWLMVSTVVDVVLSPIQQRILEEILRSARDLPPEVRAFFESLRGAEASAIGYILEFFVRLFFGAGFAAVGGMIGAVFFRNDVPPALGGPPPPLP